MERVRLRHFCAVEDQGFTVTYELRGTMLESIGFDFDEHGAGVSGSGQGDLAANGKVDMCRIRFPECPYCASRETLICGHGYAICGGRSDSKRFVCRKSCGSVTGIKLHKSLDIDCERADRALPAPAPQKPLPRVQPLALPKPAPPPLPFRK